MFLLCHPPPVSKSSMLFISSGLEAHAGNNLFPPVLCLRLVLLHRFASWNAKPCSRGHTLSPADSPLLPGECIEGTFGFNRLGWLPLVPYKPKLEVRPSGEMIVTRRDGSQVRPNTDGAGEASSISSCPSTARSMLVFSSEALPGINCQGLQNVLGLLFRAPALKQYVAARFTTRRGGGGGFRGLNNFSSIYSTTD